MKIKVDGDDNELHLQVNGDIYKEHAECLCDMAFGHAQRGVKKVDIQITVDREVKVNDPGPVPELYRTLVPGAGHPH